VAGIAIDAEQCKGCGLCVNACPQRVIAIGTRINARGQFYAVATDPRRCIACRSCSIACPDAAIEVRAWGVAYECFAY
jgi:2-oxoglutarate ferredoxin oxidoreductase subunit delta